MFELYAATMTLAHATTRSAPANMAALRIQLVARLGVSNSVYSERIVGVNERCRTLDETVQVKEVKVADKTCVNALESCLVFLFPSCCAYRTTHFFFLSSL